MTTPLCLASRLLLSILAACLLVTSQSAFANEIQYSSKDFAKLDTFEAVAVEDADKLFNKKDYRGAYAAYKAYSIEFAQGRALPYVLLRMGRCLHLAGKRNTATKAYQDVVDYFPDDVAYAAAAMFYIGQCHQQNGNEDKALAVWAKMVKDKDYVGQANSGSALIQLASAMQKRGNHAEAADYQWRTAVAFRKSNPKAAEEARRQVIYHYAVRSPNHAKLGDFYKEVGGFDRNQRKVETAQDSEPYWRHVLGVVLGAKLEDAKRVQVCQYWDGQMGDRFADSDAVRVSWFNTRLGHDKDAKAWAQRMDKQFLRKPVTIERVKQWLGYFGRAENARAAFYKKHGLPLVKGLDAPQQMSLVRHLRHPFKMHDEAAAVLSRISTKDMDDKALREYAWIVADYQGEEAFLRAVAKMKDADNGARTRFDWYFSKSYRNGEMQKKALAEVGKLKNSTDHAQAIVWNHAVLMQWQGEYNQAIKLYRSANRQPQSTWAVIDCFIKMKQYPKAVQLCKELESVGGATASQACLKAADIYRVSGDKGKEVQQLQLVLRRYPKSSHSSEAHRRLESYGVKLIGGESEAEE